MTQHADIVSELRSRHLVDDEMSIMSSRLMEEAADEIERLRARLNSEPAPEAILLQARVPGGEWIDIFPAQLSWMARGGLEVRALERANEQGER